MIWTQFRLKHTIKYYIDRKIRIRIWISESETNLESQMLLPVKSAKFRRTSLVENCNSEAKLQSCQESNKFEKLQFVFLNSNDQF